ncbi:MAG: alkylmercury lyase MerB [Gammaproteobacteria bacterium]|nr:alkylmercury lyase MerB [Gammaproteobacteria bacterium]
MSGAGECTAGNGSGRSGEPPDPRGLVDRFRNAFPRLSVEEQRLSLALYGLLAQGRPVSAERLADTLGQEASGVRRRLEDWPGVLRDAQGAVIGFLGLAIGETAHRFRVGGTTLYTWCAWDALFLPELLGATAQVESSCPATGQPIRLTVGPQRVEAVAPARTVLSFLVPGAEDLRLHTISRFCHYVHFFASAAAGQGWMEHHEGTYLMTLEDGFGLARAVNGVRYPDLLGGVRPAD